MKQTGYTYRESIGLAPPKPWDTPPEAPPGFDVWREQPTMPATLEAQVWVPFCWSAITAGAAAAAVGIAALYWHWTWAVPALAFIAVFLVAWLALSGYLRKLLHAVETITGTDIDGDDKVGAPKLTLRVELEEHGQLKRVFDPELFGFESDAAFREFCRRLLAMGSLTESTWGKDKVSFPGGINDFRKARSRMEEAGYIERVGATWTPTRTLMSVARAVSGSRVPTHTNGSGKVDESEL